MTEQMPVQFFQAAHASGDDWKSALTACLQDLDPLDDANLGILYVTEPLAPHFSSVLLGLKAATDIDQWVGAVGLGICGIGRHQQQMQSGEYFEEAAISVMTVRLPENAFDILPTIDTLDDFSGVGKPTNDNIIGNPGGPGVLDGIPFLLLHGDSHNPDVLSLVSQIAEQTEGFLVGGLTVSETADHHVAGRLTGGGVSGIAFSPDINVATAVTQGCGPIGQVHEVTDCADNIIAALDGESALNVFKEDIGIELAADLRQLVGNIHVALPVVGSDTGDYVVRNLIGVDMERGLLALGEPVDKGDRLFFVSRDADAARQDLIAMTTRLKKRSGGTPKAGLYVSCIARGPQMFSDENSEIELIRLILGDIPLVGVYLNGEISNNRLYTYTGVLTLFN